MDRLGLFTLRESAFSLRHTLYVVEDECVISICYGEPCGYIVQWQCRPSVTLCPRRAAEGLKVVFRDWLLLLQGACKPRQCRRAGGKNLTFILSFLFIYFLKKKGSQ